MCFKNYNIVHPLFVQQFYFIGRGALSISTWMKICMGFNIANLAQNDLIQDRICM